MICRLNNTTAIETEQARATQRQDRPLRQDPWQQRCAGFRPKGRVRQPGADASPFGERQARNRQATLKFQLRGDLHCISFRMKQKKKTPAPEGGQGLSPDG